MLISGAALVLYGHRWIKRNSGPRRADGLLFGGLGYTLLAAGLITAVLT